MQRYVCRPSCAACLQARSRMARTCGPPSTAAAASSSAVSSPGRCRRRTPPWSSISCSTACAPLSGSLPRRRVCRRPVAPRPPRVSRSGRRCPPCRPSLVGRPAHPCLGHRQRRPRVGGRMWAPCRSATLRRERVAPRVIRHPLHQTRQQPPRLRARSPRAPLPGRHSRARPRTWLAPGRALGRHTTLRSRPLRNFIVGRG